MKFGSNWARGPRKNKFLEKKVVNSEGETPVSLTVKANGTEFEKCPPGTHIARCYMLVDLGTQAYTYKGEPKSSKKVRIFWELPDELMADNRPFGISKAYTASLSEKANLRKDLESWRGRAFTEEELEGFSLTNILDKACLLSVIHETKDEKTFANIAAVMALPKGTPTPASVNPIKYFDLDDFTQEEFDSLPEWIQKTIKESSEYKALTAPASDYVQNDFALATAGNTFSVDELLTEDDIPF